MTFFQACLFACAAGVLCAGIGASFTDARWRRRYRRLLASRNNGHEVYRGDVRPIYERV